MSADAAEAQQNTSEPQRAESFIRHVSGVARWAGPVVVAVAGAAMLWWGWGGWPDPQIDFGQQLYVAWQLSEGKVLYTDIAWHHGPLSAYLNALWFCLFGVSLRTIVLCNIGLLAVLVALLYSILARIGGRLSATVACVVFLTVFALGQQTGYGNYNFICPYEHGATHGLLLSVLGIYALSVYHRRRSLPAVGAVGLILGLVFLTKAEVFLAAVLAIVPGLKWTFWVERPSGLRVTKLVGVFLACVVVAPVIAFGLFCLVMSPNEALTGVLGSWPAVLRGEASQTVFHRGGMGVLDAGENIKAMLRWTGGYAAMFVPAAGLGLLLRKPGVYRILISAVVFAGLVGFLVWLDPFWSGAARVLPLVLLVAGVICLVTIVRHRCDLNSASLGVLRLTAILFALALLAKMILNVRTYQYGFVLAPPAAMLLVVILLSWLPNVIERSGGYGGLFRATALAGLVVAVYGHLAITQKWFAEKKHTVAAGRDAFRADIRGKAVNLFVNDISKRLGEKETLVVIPDGTMINYLARRVNSTPYNFFAPEALLIYGEDRMLDAFQSHPPDYIVLVHKDDTEFGFRFFGQGYGQRIMAWVRGHYHDVKRIGQPPLQSQYWGIMLLKRGERGGAPR